MADHLFTDGEASPSQTTDPWVDNSLYAPTPGNLGYSPGYSFSPSPYRTLPQETSDRLGFLPLDEWDESGEYDVQPPQYVCYTIQWKLSLNQKKVGGETAKDLVVAPSDYWKKCLNKAVEDMLQTTQKPGQRVRYESTTIEVSVNDKSQKPLEKFYPSTINWRPVEAQLCKWSNLLRIGKRLTVTITFKYRRDTNDEDPLSSIRRSKKRRRVTATTSMLAERAEDIAAEEEISGRPCSWSLVYELMQCNVKSCQLNSDWCWEDPRDGKHYKLREPHLDRLIEYVDNDGKLEGHGDVPRDIRQDLIRESQTGRRSKRANSPAKGSPYHPVNINVLPAQTQQALMATPSPTRPSIAESLMIPGPREQAIRNYCKWLELMATEDDYKADFRRICQVTLENLLDLDLIAKGSDRQFLINFYRERGNKIGTILNFMDRIYEWVQHERKQVSSAIIAESLSDDED
ncbi:hypothetical protein EIK77_009238 [Talaromyces pinophilus]|nr:hypothetical protein EIK77_009238 [Talaromyces pinophilus]